MKRVGNPITPVGLLCRKHGIIPRDAARYGGIEKLLSLSPEARRILLGKATKEKFHD
jgi:hypothetical protein